MKTFNIQFPDDLHQELKIICAEQGDTMHNILLELIGNFVNKFRDAKTED